MQRFVLLWIVTAGLACAAEKRPKPVPVMQAIPLPNYEVSFQRDGKELARYHYGPDLNRPFVYPIIGVSGRSLTRMGHPHDPESHSHHNSMWISHHDIDGVSFWDDRSKGRIVHRRIERLDDGQDSASLLTVNAWIAPTNRVLMNERRLTTVRTLASGEWLLLLDLELEPEANEVVFGKTPFGLIGVRMAKTIGVHDGGGTIRNSEGSVDEAGVLWKPARWADYSGPVTASAIEGITLMDHPKNPNHPTVFHARDDGWMGASLTFAESRSLAREQPLRLRYGLYVHAGTPSTDAMEKRWKEFAAMELPSVTTKKK
jgi:hypothetical protein